jgi:transposase
MFFPEQYRVFLRAGCTDMRKSINTLAIVVSQEMLGSPMSGDLFVFCNRRRDILKVLYWDRNGFCLWQKKLEKHRFPWPRDSSQTLEINSDDMVMLLKGIDFFSAHEELIFST